MSTENPLSQQACSILRSVWSPAGKALYERCLWLAVLEIQIDLGLEPPGGVEGAVDAYQWALHDYDHDRAVEIERRTRHDVKARIEHYNEQAGREAIHLGMTSADAVDNVALMQMHATLEHLHEEHGADTGEYARRLPLRGIKGPVGTQQDQVDLLGQEGALELDRRVANRLGFERVLESTGQVYHRSIDLEWASHLSVIAPVQHPARTLLSGYMSMIASYQGDTWNEGDVSQSVVRRVALPGVAFAVDWMLNSN